MIMDALLILLREVGSIEYHISNVQMGAGPNGTEEEAAGC